MKLENITNPKYEAVLNKKHIFSKKEMMKYVDEHTEEHKSFALYWDEDGCLVISSLEE